MSIVRSRTRVPTHAPPPEWPDHAPGLRILVEHPDPVVRDILERELHDRGHEVVACGGPHPEDSRAGVSCPLLHQEHCPAVDGADVVVTGLPLQQTPTRMMLRRVRAQHPELPVIMEVSGHVAAQYDADLSDAHLWPLTVDRLCLLVDHLADARPPA